MPVAPDPPDKLLQELRETCAGLLYPSESDEAFDAFVWEATESDAVRQIASMGKPVAPLNEQSVDDFFRELIASDDAARYEQMRRLLESRLSGLRVLRIGEIEVSVYLLGKTSLGAWAGLHTMSVET